jgi:tetratricopeptide (TPR) repeat protein
LLQAAYDADPKSQERELKLALALQGAGEYSDSLHHAKQLLTHGETAELHRLAGELYEKLADPLAAVHEFEAAVRLDPSEPNYFEWGAELLLHRAILQAQEVFQRGATAYPQSSRMLTGLGTALFGGARYDDAARSLCDASDLNPTDAEPYMFMGKIELAAPNALPCIDQKLARFLLLQPNNAMANYFYAMSIWKSREKPGDTWLLQQVETVLTKAVTLDSKCADGYFQLGNLYSSQRDYQKAAEFYRKAIASNPQLDEAYYKLGVSYDRIGEHDKAEQQYQLHDEIRKAQAAAVEKQRKEVKQFLVVVPNQPTVPATK